MGDLKDQLAAIRSTVKRANSAPSEFPSHPPAGEQAPPRRTPSPVAGVDKFIARLPFLERINDFNVNRGYGFIATGAKSLFFHASRRLPNGHPKITEDLRDRVVLLAIGSSPKDGRAAAAQWCLVDDLSWESGQLPAIQHDLDQIREKWFAQQRLQRLFDVLRADWYQGVTPDGNPAADLADPILQKTLVERLKVLAPAEWRSNGVRDALLLGRYAFLSQWNWESDKYPPELLVREFAPAQLVTLGNPRYNWLYGAPQDLKAKLFEWALRAEWDEPERPLGKWAVDLRCDFPWDSTVTKCLLGSDEALTSVATEWLRRQRDAGRLSPESIRDRLWRFPSEVDVWFEALPKTDKLLWLTSRFSSPTDVANFVASRSDRALEQWAIAHYAVAVDIESDGETIWEIGVASDARKSLLLNRTESADNLANAIKQLNDNLEKSTLVIGHNIQAWDWPILSCHLPDAPEPVFWDTLLVGFMLEPWKSTHALGGTHRADQDAADTFKLFQSQIARLGNRIGLRLLNGELASTIDLMRAIGDALQTLDWHPPTVPAGIPGQVFGLSREKILILPPAAIALFAWVENVTVVSADPNESIDPKYMIIDGNRFRQALDDSHAFSPMADALSSVLGKSASRKVDVRFGILPFWVAEHPEISDAIRTALSMPSSEHVSRRIACYPTRGDWYLTINGDQVVLVDPPAGAFIAEDKWLRASKLPAQIQQEFFGRDVPRNGALYRWCVTEDPLVRLWTSLDPAAKRLSTTGECWRTFKTISLPSDRRAVSHSERPQGQKPYLLAGAETRLFPGAEDQATYWTEVLAGCLSVAAGKAIGTVTLLLIGSSDEIKLLRLLKEALVELGNSALVELGNSEAKVSRHGRRERLVRAARINHGCLVDKIQNWPEWRSVGEVAGVTLAPVIESVPIDDWYATGRSGGGKDKVLVHDEVQIPDVADVDDADPDCDDAGPESDEADDEFDPSVVAPARVALPVILALVPKLVRENMAAWLWQIGAADCALAPVLLDPRIGTRSKDSLQWLNVLPGRPVLLDPAQVAILDRVFEPLRIVREEAPSDYESMRAFLERYWNKKGTQRSDPGWIPDFRDGTQKPAMEAIRDRSSDVLVTLPTGEGKSVLFQVPALCRGLRTRRLTLVISPLRALMRDQVERLRGQGFHQSVDYLSADRAAHDIDDVFLGVLDHRIVLLYVAPERFRSKRFVESLDRRFESDGAFEYVVIDETHCVSQWGYEFRPDYFYAIEQICAKYRRDRSSERTPFLLFSATVTAACRDHLASLTKGNNSSDDVRYLPFIARPDQYFHPIRSHISIDPRRVQGSINTTPKTDWPIAPRLEIIDELITESTLNRKRTGQHSALIVFVSRRDHAEQLSFLIDKKKLVHVDYFHAGLDAETRADVYAKFKNGSIDVLVATKAFGMGMDIPHIHWSVHLAPPAFLEDYLQEVGRIGRGEDARLRAELSALKAVLFYSDEDFQRNRSNIQRSQIELRQVDDLYAEIQSRTKNVGGVAVAMMPDAGFGSFDSASKRRTASTQVRKTLYWLERLKRVEILTMMPGLLPVRLSADRLGEIAADESGPVAEVAASLVSLVARAAEQSAAATRTAMAATSERGAIERILDGLSNFVGFLFGASRAPNPENIQPQPSPPKPVMAAVASTMDGDAIINLGQVWRDTSLKHVDDVLSAIAELELRNGLKITRTIGFARGRHSYVDPDDIGPLFDRLGEVCDLILRRLKDHPTYAIDFDNLGAAFPETRATGEAGDVRTAIERSACYLLRSGGVRIRDRLVAEGRRELVATLSASKIGVVQGLVKSSLRAARELWQKFNPLLDQANRQIEVSTLLLAANQSHSGVKRFCERDLRRNLGVLGSMQLISVSEPLVPMAYVLALNPIELTLDGGDHPEVWAELRHVNRLTELRGDAIEIFVHLPPDARDAFIEGYFAQTTAEQMELFLNTQLGLIEENADEDGDDATSGFVQQKLAHLRATAVEEFFQRYKNEPEEPQQWAAIAHPFNCPLIVNAGPGSGKTSVLIARIAHLIRNQHLRPEEILVLAFNRAVVFEIRARIRKLFAKLGYGAYVRRLNVSTFHAFATRHLARTCATDDWKADRENLLVRFADQLDADKLLQRRVSGGLRSILIDEFQDMNDDLFRIVRAISVGAGPGCGVMVIGDDDQDILRWNRVTPTSSETYFKRFVADFGAGAADGLTLAINFRSGERIVEDTQDFLNNFFRNADRTADRLKAVRLRPAKDASNAEALAIDAEDQDSGAIIGTIADLLTVERDAGTKRSTAILCRTNNEVARAFCALRPHYKDLQIQNNDSYLIAPLRHVGCWTDLLRLELTASGDRPLTVDLRNRVREAYGRFDFPELTDPRPEDIVPDQLWDLCVREQSYPYLSHLIEFVDVLDSNDVVRLMGLNDGPKHSAVVSTIHKVKGLEFDQVIVLPSSASFPLDKQRCFRDGASLIEDAAAEARLLYVAMTRAKRCLRYHIGPREKAWFDRKSFAGEDGGGKVLSGVPDEVRISWAWEKDERFNPDPEATLDYIERHVRVGDKLAIGGYGMSLFHDAGSGKLNQVGYLAKRSGAGASTSDLTVSAVFRYSYNGKQYYPEGKTAPSVAQQGWGLVVLASGVLR